MNLPYVQDGDIVVSQSNAVLLYLGRKACLNGSNDQEVTKNEQTMFQAFDLRNATVTVFYRTYSPESVKLHFTDILPGHYQKFEDWLGSHKTQFFSSDTPLSADFHVFEMIDQHEGIFSNI